MNRSLELSVWTFPSAPQLGNTSRHEAVQVVICVIETRGKIRSGTHTKTWRCGRESNPRIAALQAAALPLGHRTSSPEHRHCRTCPSKLTWAATANHKPLRENPNRYFVTSLHRRSYFAPPAAAAAPLAALATVSFTTGAPIKFPHSVHDP